MHPLIAREADQFGAVPWGDCCVHPPPGPQLRYFRFSLITTCIVLVILLPKGKKRCILRKGQRFSDRKGRKWVPPTKDNGVESSQGGSNIKFTPGYRITYCKGFLGVHVSGRNKRGSWPMVQYIDGMLHIIIRDVECQHWARDVL